MVDAAWGFDRRVSLLTCFFFSVCFFYPATTSRLAGRRALTVMSLCVGCGMGRAEPGGDHGELKPWDVGRHWVASQ